MASSADPRSLRTTAPAKINWTFEVLGRRPDGYHEVRTVMQTLSLADDLTGAPATESALHVEGAGAAALASADNLVARAEAAVPSPYRASPVAFRLTKRIPAAAGLGGGSSDAAAALRLMQRIWDLPDDVIRAAAASIGSDVPFFLRGGTQVASGRGEVLTPLPDVRPCTVLLATPPITLPDKTARLYARLTPAHYSDGAATERLAARIRSGEAVGRDHYVNAFDAVAAEVFPGLADYRIAFAEIVGVPPMLAGAGPTLFAVVDAERDGDPLDALCDALRRGGFLVAPARTIGAEQVTALD